MKSIVFREMQTGEEQIVCDLVTKVFNEFVAPDYGDDGVETFLKFANHRAMRERMQLDGFVILAYKGDTLVGMLEFYLPDRIAMLFVTVRRQGIAKELLSHAINKARALNSSLTKVTVHSSPYAEPIYQKLGFIKTGDIATENGITYIPMELLLTEEMGRPLT